MDFTILWKGESSNYVAVTTTWGFNELYLILAVFVAHDKKPG